MQHDVAIANRKESLSFRASDLNEGEWNGRILDLRSRGMLCNEDLLSQRQLNDLAAAP
jgi:hypothetical protein